MRQPRRPRPRRRAALAFVAGVVAAACAAALPAHAAVETGRAVPSCHGHRATIFGAGNLVGTSRRDVIVGTSDDPVFRQSISAGGGDDLVCAGPSGAYLHGGGGDDRLFGHGGAAADGLDGGPGADLLDPGAGVGPCCTDVFFFDGSRRGVTVDLKAGTATGQGKDRLVVTPGSDSVVGSAHDDVLLGTDSADELDPGWGDDVVRGRGGHDVISSWSFDGRLYGGPGRDHVFACNGAIFGGRDADVLSTAVGIHICDSDPQGPVTIVGGRGADVIGFAFELRDGDVASGGPGVDELSVFFGWSDMAYALSGSPVTGDLATGAFAMDGDHASYRDFERWSIEVRGGSVITGSEGPDVLSVGQGPLTAHLLGGDDTVDSVAVSPVDDYVDGGDGTDAADLGDGNDVCVNVESGLC